jgi:branched-chain amino acid transport system substrate-binding protein
VDGVKAAINYTNAHGGIDGKAIDLISYDDANDPAKNAQYARQLALQDNVVADVGDSSLVSAGGQPILTQAGVPVIGFGGDGFWGHDNFFAFTGDGGSQTAYSPWDAYMEAAEGVKKVAIISLNAPQGALTDAAANTIALKKLGVQVVQTSYIPVTLSDFQAVVARAISAGADAIEGNLPTAIFVSVIQAGEQLGFKGSYFGGGGTNQSELTALGSLASQVSGRVYGVIYSVLPSSTLPSVQLAVANLPAADKQQPYALAGWAEGMLFVYAAKKVGPDRAKILKFLQTLKGYTADGIMPPTQFDNGSMGTNCVMRVVSKGTSFAYAPSQNPSKFSCGAYVNTTAS